MEDLNFELKSKKKKDKSNELTNKSKKKNDVKKSDVKKNDVKKSVEQKPYKQNMSSKKKEDIELLTSRAEEILKEIKDGVYDDETMDLFNKFYETKIKRSKLDKDLINTLKHIFENNKVKDNKQKHYQSLLKDLQEDDIIIYFKDADKLALYNTSRIMDLIIRFDGVDNMYEVVHNDKPQKIIIVGDSSINSDIKKVKNIIIDFMKKRDHDINSEEIFVFDNQIECKTEFIITSFCVNDNKEKDDFIRDLIKYINKNVKDGDKIVEKLKNKMLISDINSSLDDVSSHHIAFSNNHKKMLGFDDNYEPMRLLRDANMFKKFLISNVKGCNSLNPPIVNVNIVNNVNNVNVLSGNVNVGNTEINNNTNIDTSNPKYNKLIKKIIKDKPSWYKLNTYIKKKDITKNIRLLLDEEISDSIIWKNIKDKIIDSEHRRLDNGKRCVVIKLKNLWKAN